MPKVVVTDSKGLIQESGAGIEIKGDESTTVPAYIALKAADGTLVYLHVNATGTKLYLSDAAPDGDGSSAAASFVTEVTLA